MITGRVKPKFKFVFLSNPQPPYLDVRVDDELIASPEPKLSILNLRDGGQVPGGLFSFSMVPHKDDVVILTRWPLLHSYEVWN
jgi:hypothetical protein